MRNKIVVISVPFSRNFRFLISSKIYVDLKKNNDILIVSSSKKEEFIEKEFGGANVKFFYTYKDHFCLPKIPRLIYLFTEALRRFGYYYKYRNEQLRYYWKISTSSYSSVLNKDGSPVHQGLIYRLLCRLMGVLGRDKNVWRIVSNYFGSVIFDVSVIHKLLSRYDEVVIIQTANWGYQERFLSFLSYKYKYKNILIPYTTDQILINGHMISDYDVYCPQGKVEERYLLDLHNVSSGKICKLGMLWMRNIETVRSHRVINRWKVQEKQKAKHKIMYTGLTYSGFPIECELESVDKILDGMDSGIINVDLLIYRPVVHNIIDKKSIENKYSNISSIRLQWPQKSMIGVSEDFDHSVHSEIYEYVKQIEEVSLMVMSATTTMAFDAFNMGIPCIANFYDCTGSFDKNGFSSSYIETDEFIISAKGMPIVYSLDCLVDEIIKITNSIDPLGSTADNVFDYWDYKNKNYVNDFMNLL